MGDICIICGEEDKNLTECRDAKSWSTLHNAAVIKEHKRILDVAVGENGFPEVPIKYHRSCRAGFTHKKSLQSSSKSNNAESSLGNQTRKSTRTVLQGKSSVIEPDHCIFCKKTKYKPKSKTREKTHSCLEFRSDKKVRDSALLHIKKCSPMSEVAEQLLAVCTKDLISSEAKYHASCYKLFVKITYSDKCDENTDAEENQDEMMDIYDAVFAFCENLMEFPRVIEFKMIRKVMVDEASKLNVTVPESHYKNLIRKISATFKNLTFLHYQHNKVLVYPSSLKMEDIVIQNYDMNSELQSMQCSVSENEKNVIKVAKLLHGEIKNQPPQMSWPPQDSELDPAKTELFIPPLLRTFLTVLISGQRVDSDSSRTERTLRLRNSFGQDLVYAVSNGATKTPKSVLFPSMIKSLCNNTEILKLINKYGHGISYNLIEEIETEYALHIINTQKENRVIIPKELEQNKPNQQVALMIADNIDNLESTLGGSGTSHRVNSILVIKGKPTETAEVSEESSERPAKRKCRRSLPTDIVVREIPHYYRGKRMGPGVLNHMKDINNSSSYIDKANGIRELYLIWIGIRKLKTHPALLIPGWTGFCITMRKNIVVVESTIGYLDTIDSPATDIKTAYEVLCRGCEIKDRLELEAVVCVFDQSFYAKAAEVYWKNKELFKDLLIMLSGFHLLMTLLGIIGTRFGKAGLKELAVQSEVVAEGSIDKVLTGKNYNRAVRLHKIIYEAVMRLLVDTFEFSLTENSVNMLSDEKKEIERLKLDFQPEEVERVLETNVYREWVGRFNQFFRIKKEMEVI